MISITRLWCGVNFEGDSLRYGEKKNEKAFRAPLSAAERRPIVVWNCTRRCNLKCVHCYSDSHDRVYEDEMTTGQARVLIDQLSDYKVPVFLFSGGEPLTRPDVMTLAALAKERGMRPVLSTNGTLINEERARELKKAGFAYVGISLDGIGHVNDEFRGVEGAFKRALRGFRACKAAGVKVGLRFTLTKRNVEDLPAIFDFIEEEDVPRACFYHLVPAGRGEKLTDALLPDRMARGAISTIMNRTKEFVDSGKARDVLTVDNHCDGVAIYLRLKQEGNERADEVLELLEWNGGGAYSSGVGIACVDWFGNVHPDQFWRHVSLGNIRERNFGEIWSDTTHPLMAGLKDRLGLLQGKCGKCVYQKACGGSLRVRADIAHGSPWAEDPGCYLSTAEISKKL